MTPTKDELILTVRVVPRSSRSEIVGEIDGILKVKLSSPPVEGAANAELIKLLAKSFRIPKSAVEIVSGENSRTKRIRMIGVRAETIPTVLQPKS